MGRARSNFFALIAALAAVAPASLALASDLPDNAPVIAIEETCAGCVSPEAVEEIVDEGVAPAEMHPTTSAEAIVTDADEPASGDERESAQEIPADPLCPVVPLDRSDQACVMASGSFSVPAPSLSPLQVVSVIELRQLARAPDPTPTALLGATHAVPPVIVWLRTRTRAPASDDDHASNR